MKKNGGLPAASMSPCLRLFLESLLHSLGVELPADEVSLYGSDATLPIAFAASSSLESDKNYN